MGQQLSKSTLEQNAQSAIHPNTEGQIDAQEHQDLLLDMIASFFSIADNSNDVGLKRLDTSAQYKQGQSVIHLGSIWRAIQDVPAETFDESKWELIVGQRTRVITGDHTVVDDDQFIIVDMANAGGNVDVTLPDSSTSWSENKQVTVVKFGSANSVRILGQGGDTVNGGTVIYLSNDSGRADLVKESSGNWKTVEVHDLHKNLNLLAGNQIDRYQQFTIAKLDRLLNLTNSELDQLQNINGLSISNTEWGYLAVLDQNLRTTDDVRHQTIRSERREGEWNDTVINSNTNDLNASSQFFLRIVLEGGSYNLTGVANEADGIELVVYNADDTYTLTLTHQDTNSAGTFQFWNTSSGGSVSLPPRAMARYRYDNTYLGHWVLESISPEASIV